MSKWIRLDLIAGRGKPEPERLVALLLKPSNGKAFCKRGRYDIGEFKYDPKGGRKLWWHGTCGCEDPAGLKKHYEIWWCPVTEFDGF